MPRQTNPGTRRPSPGKQAAARWLPVSKGSLHDSLFRWIFGKPENAASQLRAVLAPELTARLDLGRLTLEPGTLVGDDLRQRHTDVLFSAPLDGEDAFVYLLMEHQSSDDRLMAFRVLQYIVRIWDRYLGEHPQARTLPAVIPLVVYNGKGKWSAPRRVQDLVDPAPGGRDAEYVPQLSFLLDDLNVIEAGQLRDRGLTPQAVAGLAALKIAPDNPRLDEDLREWVAELRAVLDGPGGSQAFMVLVAYIMGVGSTPADKFGPLADSLGPDAKETFMTTAEMLEARGEARMLVQILTAKFGALPGSASAKVNAASTAQLETWGIRAATAGTLDEIFE